MSGTTISMTINCATALGANQAWNIGPGYELALTGILSGAYSLNKTGTGLLILDAINTYSGGTTISAGTLQVQNTAALGNTGNTLTISSGGALDVYNIDLRSYTSIPQINGQVNSTTGAIINTGGNGTSESDVLRGFTLGSDASIGCNNARFDIGRTYSANTYITGNSHTLDKSRLLIPSLF